ncbi:hypothetical protein CS266P2_00020 [Clostridium phage CS266P2]|nr:hypothetical protein CS266P1_00062 [Clostridium phage CS266P1]WAX12148.1 hypothetical protein CS266P2_00020 [Clostridium phage CS266P2]WAX12320.1 hypothetical protein CS266P4_00052 [Clostridium phage CS266P4]
MKRGKENRERMNTLRSKTKQVKDIRDLQKQSLEKSTDDYMVGLYNGLEMATAILEGRKPEFLACVGEPPIVDNTEEQTGRTVANGIRRK